jgi:hypothetical protein
MTGALCLGAAAAIPGTVAAQINSSTNAELRISHPKGVSTVTVDIDHDSAGHHIRSVGIIRTARRLLSGTAYLPTRTTQPATHRTH